MTESDAGYLFEVEYSQRRDIGLGLEEVQLGGPGNVWLVYSLHGGHTLSQEVLRQGRFFGHNSGSTFTICPKGARAGHLLDFTVASMGFSEPAVPLVHDHIAQRCGLDRHLLVSDDPVARPSDPWLTNKPDVQDQTFSSGNELYHWRRPTRSTTPAAGLVDLLRWTGDYPMNAFVIAEDQGRSIGPRSEVTAGDLVALSEAVQAIITRAYDGNGFVVWVAG